MTRVYLIDDDAAVRRALALLLDTVGMQTQAFETPVSFLARLPHLEPGVLVLDMRMPVMSGPKLQEDLQARQIGWPTIMITGHGDIEACRRAFRNGVIDFLTKPVDEQDLIEAIQRGQVQLSRTQEQDAEWVEQEALLATLTPRECEILAAIAKGLSTKDIAATLELSPRTVESHRAALAAKLGTTSVAELTRLWLTRRSSSP